MVTSPTPFSDIQNSWAHSFIEALAQRNIISGFPNGTFRPNQSMNRAQFAAIVSKAFNQPKKRQYTPFIDISSGYWGATAIQKAYETGFLSGYPDQRFRPEDRITKVQALVSLVNGLGITSNHTSTIKAALSKIYRDAAQIPSYAADEIATATSVQMVVSYPNSQILNPNLAATRADVAAFIYQALVQLRQVPKISSNYIVVLPEGVIKPPEKIAVSHRREFRGVWVTTVWNTDWPSKPGLPTEQQQAELIVLLDQLQAMNFNALILQVRSEGDAVYASQLEPWSAWLTGTQGQPSNPFYDPLEFAITECHKRNIELHAWFNPYRARVSLNTTPPVHPHVAVTNPEYVYQYGNGTWMDPGAKVIQDRVDQVILDVVRRYDVDGIHLDDYFYPYPIAGQEFPDSETYAAYLSADGNLDLGDWRRDNINQLIQRLSAEIRALKSHVKFGISPFGIYRPGQPPQIKGLDAYGQLYTDSKKWLTEGWVDYLAPQLYWRIDQTAQSYPVLLKWWTEMNSSRKHIYVGNKLNQLDGKSWTLAEILNQIEISRSFWADLSLGNIFFSMSDLRANRQEIYDNFKTETYAKPALVPTMQWLDAVPPAVPTGLVKQAGQLIWNPTKDASIRGWTLYQKQGTGWTLWQILPATTTAVTVPPGTYALCAVDRVANESVGVVINS